MSTKSILIETIIAGFFLLMVIVLFVLLRMSDEELLNTSKYIRSISSGAAAIIVTMIFGFSYILGAISHRIGKDLSTLYYKILCKDPPNTNPPIDSNERLLEEYYTNWLLKVYIVH